MKLKARLLSLLGLAAALSPLPALAGPGISGGGKGVICRSSSGKIRRAELLDLWEARNLHQTPVTLRGSVPEMVETALVNLSQSIRTDDFRWVYQGVSYQGPEALLWALRTQAAQFFQTPGSPDISKLRPLRKMRLTLTDDSYEAVLPADCEIEQIVNYQDEGYLGGTILLNQDLFERLSPADQAALIAHEALYKVLRGKFGETNSLRVRRAVGQAFAGLKLSSLNKNNIPGAYYDCYAPGPAVLDPVTRKSSSRVFLLPTSLDLGLPHVPTDDELFVVIAAELGGHPLFDQKFVPKVGPGLAPVWYSARRFDDLSTITGDRDEVLYGLSLSKVQGDVQPLVRIDDAGPNGHLKISISANSTKLLPNGLAWQAATCEFHPAK